MNLDKEFKYITSLKKYIYKTKYQLKDNNYTNLEYKLNDLEKNHDFSDTDTSSSEKIFINPNTKSLSLNFNQNFIESNNMQNIDSHYKDLLDYTLKKMDNISTFLTSI